MLKSVLIAAASTAAISMAASAQYYPQRYGYGEGQNFGQARGLERRIHNVLRSLDGVRPDQRYQLRSEAIGLDRQLRYAGRNGLNPNEAHAFDVRIGQLERHLQWAAGNRGNYDRRGWNRDRGND